MHPFFEAHDARTAEAAQEALRELPLLEHLTGWNVPREHWHRLELSQPLSHHGVAIEQVPVVPSALMPTELGVDGRPRIARLMSAMLVLGHRSLDPHAPTIGRQRALDRYLAAARGEHVSSALPTEVLDDEEPYPLEGPPIPIECRWQGDAIVVRWSDERWSRHEPDGSRASSLPPPRDDWAFAEALERSLLFGPEGLHLLIEVLDYPVIQAPSPRRDHIWVMDKHGNGAIFDTRTALVIASPPPVDDRDPSRILMRDGTIEELASEEALEALDDEAHEAALIANEERLNELYDQLDARSRDHDYALGQPGALGWNGDAFLGFFEGRTPAGTQVGFPFYASAYDERAERLALVDAEGIVVLSASDDRVLSERPLD